MPPQIIDMTIHSKHPERDTNIQRDEILDLVILLNTTYDVNEFLGKLK